MSLNHEFIWEMRVDRVLALLDALLRFAPLIVEQCHPLGGTRQVGDDEADTGNQFTGMPFHLGLSFPKTSSVAETLAFPTEAR